jgi:16S rRNA (adenine1518-N6/adenine1519-N6)-dimethyltransferase
LRSSLGGATSDPASLLARAGVEPTRRAEELDVAAFVALANAVPG